MIPVYLSDLHLAEVFANYTSSIDPFIQESVVDECIVDSEQYKISGFVRPSFGNGEYLANKYFLVKNPSGVPYSLLQIDNGIIKSSTTKKCDCAIANNTYLCFVEFKANSYSCNSTVIRRNYRKAMEQLSTTINLFDSYFVSKGTDFLKLRTIEAYVCFRKGYPRKSSSEMNYQASFAKANKGIPLSFIGVKIL